MRLERGRLVSGADARQSFPPRVGSTMRMPGNGVYLSPDKNYVLTYYSGLADNEVLLTLAYSPADIKAGNPADLEPELGVSPVTIVHIEPLE
jgi:hypothetical protein